MQVPVGSSRTMQELPPLDHASVRALSLSDRWGFHFTQRAKSDQPDEQVTIFDGALAT